MTRAFASHVRAGDTDGVNDPELREEIELVAVLVAAARRHVGPLTLPEIDRLLGVPVAHD